MTLKENFVQQEKRSVIIRQCPFSLVVKYGNILIININFKSLHTWNKKASREMKDTYHN